MRDDWELDIGIEAAGGQWRDDGFTISGSGRERFHRSLFAYALLGGVLGALLGRVLYSYMYDSSGNNTVMVGLILAVISGLVLLACALCELLVPRITMNHELSLSRILLGLLCAAAVFAIGFLAEFLYELNSAYAPAGFDDYVFAIDDSESMLQTDQPGLRYSALESLLDILEEDQRVGLVRFNETAYAPVDLGELDEVQRARLRGDLTNSSSAGGTNIYGALESSLDMYRNAAQPKRLPVVVLLSDGFNSEGYGGRVRFNKTVRAFLREGVVINTVSLGPEADTALLQNLAESTGGQYVKAEEADDLAQAFQEASSAVTYRCLFSPRPGTQRWNALYMFLRVLLLTLPGLMIGFFIHLLLRNRLTNRQVLVSGLGGLFAGLVMEAGTFFFLPLGITHIFSWVLYSIVLVNYYDGASGLCQSKLETDIYEGGSGDWEDVRIDPSLRNISRRGSGSSGRIDRIDDWGTL